VLTRLTHKLHKLRSAFSRSDWAARHIYRASPAAPATSHEPPGVLLIQIDGLSYRQMLRAIDKRRLPFLQRLIQKDHYVLRQWYSGLPSATPAVQAELFYGVKCAVPAFHFYDRRKRKSRKMFQSEAVDDLAAQLEQQGEGLLQHGSCYSNIFSGGADEAPFCIQTMKFRSILHEQNLASTLWFIVIHLDHILKILALSIVEAGLALYDFFKGLRSGKNPFKEFSFVFSRIGSTIVLREIVKLHVKIDIARGMPIIHANFIGYDEHAHRRGPGSAFALWTLKGIDATIRSIVRKATHSRLRDYQIFIYSDHGQEHCRSFHSPAGLNLHETVEQLFCRPPVSYAPEAEEVELPYSSLQLRSRELFHRLHKAQPAAKDEGQGANTVRITAMGPVGHIYLPSRPDKKMMQTYAEHLVTEGGIPLVLYLEDGLVYAASKHAHGPVAEIKSEIFGRTHPFLDEIVCDIHLVCAHEFAGDFVISGWRHDNQPLTFSIENGAHGGPGFQESQGFLIMADSYAQRDKTWYRPGDLRQIVMQLQKTPSGSASAKLPALSGCSSRQRQAPPHSHPIGSTFCPVAFS